MKISSKIGSLFICLLLFANIMINIADASGNFFFSMDNSIYTTSTLTANNYIPNNGIIKEGLYELKNVNQNGLNNVTLTTPTNVGNGEITLSHSGVSRYSDWLEFNSPSVFYIQDTKMPLAFEMRFKVLSNDYSLGNKFSIGIGARSSDNYNEIIFNPDSFKLPDKVTTSDDSTWKTVQFIIQPNDGKGTVYLNNSLVTTVNCTQTEKNLLQ